jgi:hypothetical protein
MTRQVILRQSIYWELTFVDFNIQVLRLFTLVEAKVTLRLSVGQSVYLGVGHPFGVHDQILLFLSFVGKLLCSLSWDALSEERTGL